jgi:hypothetical protein
MSQQRAGEALTSERISSITATYIVGAKLRKRKFDRYEDCGCVDRWEAEGGRVAGEDQADARPCHHTWL